VFNFPTFSKPEAVITACLKKNTKNKSKSTTAKGTASSNASFSFGLSQPSNPFTAPAATKAQSTFGQLSFNFNASPAAVMTPNVPAFGSTGKPFSFSGLGSLGTIQNTATVIAKVAKLLPEEVCIHYDTCFSICVIRVY
jgi:hypothetical protein